MSLSENWTFKGKAIESVDKFCYIWLIFNYNPKLTVTQDILASQGRKAYYNLKRKMEDFAENYAVPLMFHPNVIYISI